MADYSLQDFWWNKPSRTESQLPALQLGVQIVQHKAKMDLAERDLANDIARTSLARDEMMFKQNLMLKIDAGNAELAKAAAGITDFSDQSQMKPIYDLGAKYGFLVGTKGWEGLIHTHEKAVDAKRMSLNTESLIASRSERATLNRLVEERRGLLADSTIDLNDARIAKLDKDIAYEERRMVVQEGNLAARGREMDLKEKRFDTAKWSPEDRIELKERTKVVHDDSTLTSAEKDQAIQEIRGEIEGNRIQREKFKASKTTREGLQTQPKVGVPTNAPVKIQSKDDYDKLAPGTLYIAPDGSTRTKG